MPKTNRKQRKDIETAIRNNDYRTAGQIHFQLGELTQALRMFEKGGHRGKMVEIARIYEEKGRKEQALVIYMRVGDRASVIRMKTEGGLFEDAAAMLKEDGRNMEAAKLLEKAKKHFEAATIYESLTLFEKAAENFEAAGSVRKAALNYEKWHFINEDSSNGIGVAPGQSRYRYLLKALELFAQDGDWEYYHELSAKTGLFEHAGHSALQLKKPAMAAQYFQEAGKLNRAANIFENLGQVQKACLLRGEFQLQKRNRKEAAQWFEKGNDFGRAAEYFQMAGEFNRAAQCFDRVHDFKNAAENYFKAGDKENAARMYANGQRFVEAAGIYKELGDNLKAGEFLEEAELFFEAGQCFDIAQEHTRALTNFQKVKKNSEYYYQANVKTAQIFLTINRPRLAIKRIGKMLKSLPVDAGNLELYYYLARAHEEKGDITEAQNIYVNIAAEDFAFKDVNTRLQQLKKEEKTPAKPISQLEKNKARYEILDTIGSGGMGIVHKAYDQTLNRIVAFKVFKEKAMDTRRARERLLKEAQLNASLMHENIVTVYDVGKWGEEYFISMEYVDGINLKEALKRKSQLAVPQVLFVMVKLFKALDFSHQMDIIHQDIKPSNIMISNQVQLKVLDFGISILKVGGKGKGKGYFGGTPQYMSPEQIGRENTDGRTDIYSAGITVYQLLTGRLPFSGTNVKDQHLNDPVPPIAEFRQDVPQELVDIVYRCLEKDRSHRYQSAREVLNALQEIPSHQLQKMAVLKYDGEPQQPLNLESSPPIAVPAEKSAEATLKRDLTPVGPDTSSTMRTMPAGIVKEATFKRDFGSIGPDTSSTLKTVMDGKKKPAEQAVEPDFAMTVSPPGDPFHHPEPDEEFTHVAPSDTLTEKYSPQHHDPPEPEPSPPILPDVELVNSEEAIKIDLGDDVAEVPDAQDLSPAAPIKKQKDEMDIFFRDYLFRLSLKNKSSK